MERLTACVLEANLAKWRLQFRIYEEADNTLEKDKLEQECVDLWERKRNLLLLSQDQCLLDDRCEQRSGKSVKWISTWLGIRKLAMEEGRAVLSMQK